jgi:glycosyltransferase involved in cell wall biosynthesis
MDVALMRPVRVLYSFPHRLGTGRICTTAWEQIKSVAAAGAQVTVLAPSIARPLPSDIRVITTLAWGKVRVPYRLVGDMRAFAAHDLLVARYLGRNRERVDLLHVWPLGGLRTLAVASRLGIPSLMERPNAHTRFAYEAVRAECERIGVPLPSDHEHAHNPEVLRIEEEEYERAFRLLCPSAFTAQTFRERGFPPEKLLRHFYGFDESIFHTDGRTDSGRPFTALFVGVCAVRKGLHYALEAWLRSEASRNGQFLIAGEFLAAYEKRLAPMLSHPSVRVLGHRSDVPELMRRSDILLLPTIEEGFGLVCTEAMASGCVPLVSRACTDLCRHGQNALVHAIADVETLTSHITELYEEPGVLGRLRESGVREARSITWTAAGHDLLRTYRQVVAEYDRRAAEFISSSSPLTSRTVNRDAHNTVTTNAEFFVRDHHSSSR